MKEAASKRRRTPRRRAALLVVFTFAAFALATPFLVGARDGRGPAKWSGELQWDWRGHPMKIGVEVGSGEGETDPELVDRGHEFFLLSADKFQPEN